MMRLEFVWNFSDLMNGLMAIPNLIALLMLSKIVKQETDRYFKG
jgi:AGCS family alanine or glycine:cation symporter